MDRSSPGAVRGKGACALVGFLAGIAGGLIGLGGAELRLPFLVGVLGLLPHTAVPVNLAVSLATLVAALPVRLGTTAPASLAPFAAEAAAICAGAVVSAWLGAGWLARLSPAALSRAMLVLLAALGLLMIGEALLHPGQGDGAMPAAVPLRLAAGALAGLGIGAISSVLGVAGGEVIIPTLVLGFGVPVKAAGTLSLLISLPTVLVGMVRHARRGGYARPVIGGVIVPMAAGAVAGAALGGRIVGLVPARALAFCLGVLLLWSACKVFAHRRPA